MRNLLFAALLVCCISAFAQSDIEWITDPYEVRLNFDAPAKPDPIKQQQLREAGAWKAFSADHDQWFTIMSTETDLPHRAWGKPIELPGADEAAKAEYFITNELAAFGVRAENLTEAVVNKTSKHTWVRYGQMEDGYKVERSSVVLKFHEGRLIMWGADYYPNAEVPADATLTEEWITASLQEEMNLTNMEITHDGFVLYPLPENKGHNLVLAAKVWVTGFDMTIPKKYMTYVDAATGEVINRFNTVMHVDPKKGSTEPPAPKRVLSMGMPVVISGTFEGTGYATNVLNPQETLSLGYLNFDLNGQSFTAGVDGGFITTVTGPAQLETTLEGSWCSIENNGVTPSINSQIADGYNVINWDNSASIREISTYASVNRIHDHMKTWLPDFTGLDEPLQTNIDVAGECNAFYDGASINFYPDGGGCNPTSLLSDVVYHEYGHGINGRFYISQGQNFNNGAMNEGYADFWSMSLTDSPLLAPGFYDDSEDPLRRYDIDPKIYPEDLAGQVHNDGEIICGAWWDTHLLMGSDWDVTEAIFVEAFSGLQATAQNGDEGAAYTDVLLDALQADDDDGDLGNGTPNGAEILEGFDMHGITLFSYAEIEHEPIEMAPSQEAIQLVAETEIVFPFSQFFDSVRAFYRFSPDEEFQSDVMTDEGGDVYTLDVDPQGAGTIIEYYFAIQDNLGGVSAVDPVAANKEIYPNLPYFTLVGVMPLLINDSDDFTEMGVFELDGDDDNATTGQWDETVPVGSFSDVNDPSTIVAPDEDHTDTEFGFCFVTGENPGGNAGVGENDVDGGHTTLISPVIDLTEYDDPIFAYWRWYANAPATGANPGADWWQVELSDDGGSSWTYLENNLTQDISWRRNAFRISDYVDLTDEFQMRFIASDSIRPGVELDGGSLIEAAVDDLVLYESENFISVEENEAIQIGIFPNPANEQLSVTIQTPGGELELIDARGSVVYRRDKVFGTQVNIPVDKLAAGSYFVRYSLEGNQYSKLVQVRH